MIQLSGNTDNRILKKWRTPSHLSPTSTLCRPSIALHRCFLTWNLCIYVYFQRQNLRNTTLGRAQVKRSVGTHTVSRTSTKTCRYVRQIHKLLRFAYNHLSFSSTGLSNISWRLTTWRSSTTREASYKCGNGHVSKTPIRHGIGLQTIWLSDTYNKWTSWQTGIAAEGMIDPLDAYLQY